MTLNELRKIYENAFQKEPFMKLCDSGTFPGLNDVVRSNRCHIGLGMQETSGVAVIVSVIDNLVKGAAGQAVQNMNIMCGISETEGLV